MIIRIVKMTFIEGTEDEFRQLFARNREKILASEGCLLLELWNDPSRPAVFFTCSHWEEESHLEAYRQGELFRTVWPITKSLFAEPPAAWTLQREYSSGQMEDF